jgi:hypothetical protein
MDINPGTRPSNPAAVVWLDMAHAFVARSRDGHPAVTEVHRAFDLEPAYLLRVLHAAADCERLVVMGPDAARVALEREYVSIYRRPDRLIDAGQVSAPREVDLVDHLRMLEPSIAAVR